VDKLINQAKGESVTKERLTGDERYYPDASYLFSGETSLTDDKPQYIVLLTTGSSIAKGTPSVSPGEEGIEIKTGNSSLVFAEHSLFAVGAGIGGIFGNSPGFIQISYESIGSTGGIGLLEGGTMSITVDGTEIHFDLANKYGDSQNVAKAFRFLQKKIA